MRLSYRHTIEYLIAGAIELIIMGYMRDQSSSMLRACSI